MNTKNQYLLLFSGNEWYNRLSAAEIQKVIEESKTWFERLGAAGKIKGAQALARDGATVSGKNGRVISDGPFAETKEAIGGYLLLEAASLEEAIAIAKENPAVSRGTTIEVRPLSAECPLDARARHLGINNCVAEVQLASAA
jgi:hypothetical protein